MNERDMQFRIGLFVIAAGLVLTMLTIWFGESPSLLRDHAFVKVRYADAPGVAEGITVRKSGIRIGEVLSIAFDDPSGGNDGVIVILSLDKKIKLRKDSRARISRSLIGDVAIDMQPGASPDLLEYGKTPGTAPEIAGEVPADPFKAIEVATAAFDKVGGTLEAIKAAATGLSTIAKKADKIDEFITTIDDAGRNISKAAKGIDKVIGDNEANLVPTIANLRQFSDKLAVTFDDPTVARFKVTMEKLATVSAKLDTGLADLQPLLADLGNPASKPNPTTNFGQSLYWLNRITANVNLLTNGLNDGKGRLNPNGSLQKLINSAELHDSLTKTIASANQVIALIRPAVKSIGVFAEKLAQDPGAIGRGVLQR